MKILILGAKGNLGVQLQEVFQADNEVIAWDREEFDITDKELILKKIKELSPNVIINSAAYNAVDKCEEDEEEFNLAKKLNGDAPGYLAKAALEADALLIHYSSDYVFDGKNTEGYDEKAAPKPINNYGKTKLQGEKNIIKLSGKGLKYYVIRTSKLFGPKGESDVAKPSFFDIMLKLGKEKEYLDVVDSEVSCFTYTPDLALWTKKLIDSGKGSGIYHFVNEESCTWYRAAKELFKIARIKIKINPVSPDNFQRPAKRPKFSVLINTKFAKMRNYKRALREYIK